MNEFTVIKTGRKARHKVEFRETNYGGIYASVTRNGLYICDGEWPDDVIEYVGRVIEQLSSERGWRKVTA